MSEATPNRSANSRLCWCSSQARSSSPNSACIDPRLTSVPQLSCELIASAISKLRSSSSSPPRSPMSADRKSTRLNSSHVKISYAVFCLKKKKKNKHISKLKQKKQKKKKNKK